MNARQPYTAEEVSNSVAPMWGRHFTILLCAMGAILGALFLACIPGDSLAQSIQNRVYTLGSGDRLRVTVFGEEDLSGKFEVDGTGRVAMPLIGEVPVQGLSLRQAERAIAAKLAEGYLKSPRVSIDVENYRPFYILGEVNNPGSYSFVSGMSILNAVALGGGFTHRANESTFLLKRGGDDSGREIEVAPETRILPGDIIRVKERFF